MEKEIFSKEIILFLVALFFWVIWLRQRKKIKEEQKWIAKIIKENPHLSEEELVEKIKSELLKERLRTGRPLSQEIEMKIKEKIRQSLKEIRQNLKDYK